MEKNQIAQTQSYALFNVFRFAQSGMDVNVSLDSNALPESQGNSDRDKDINVDEHTIKRTTKQRSIAERNKYE